ncbi:CFEM-domain-containing protein [Cubamyces sp. BRFM 1775]|nr:CFEM-domain-containing protein [Cubamyces sp. BRFM 1775]
MLVRPAFAHLFVVGLLAGTASAQTTPTIPPCAIPCVVQAASSGSGCTSFTDVSCICHNSTLVNMIGKCVAASCPENVQQQAIQLFEEECDPVQSTTSTPSTTPASESSTSHASTTPTSASSHATSESHTASESVTHSASATSRANSSTAAGTETASTDASTLTVPPSSITASTPATVLPVSASGDAVNSTGLAGNGTMTATSATVISTSTSGPSNTTSGVMALKAQVFSGGMSIGVMLTVAAAMFGAGMIL